MVLASLGRVPERPGLDDGQLLVAVDQHIIGNLWLAALPGTHDAAGCNHLAAYSAAIDDAPARRLQRGVNIFSSSFCFIHNFIPPREISLPREI